MADGRVKEDLQIMNGKRFDGTKNIFDGKNLGNKKLNNFSQMCFIGTELKTLEWWISGLMLDPLFFLISRLT